MTEEQAIALLCQRLRKQHNELTNASENEIFNCYTDEYNWYMQGWKDEKEFKSAETTALAAGWVAYDFNDLKSRPPKPEQYFVCRKDGKIHWERWNGSGWAYNEKEIRYWMKITPPPKSFLSFLKK